MQKIKLIETFDGTPAVSLVENDTVNESISSDSRVDGKYIIGMIEGQFFKPDGMSRNGRWYPRSLWEKALNSADVKNRFTSSTMFGEIGHSDGPVEDMTLRQGCASHFVDSLWIDDKGRGMGRAYILNTPTGQLLKTYLGAGCKLKVSTRGEGLYKEGCTHDGRPVVDDDTYELQTADFVISPGFLETSAILKEEYNKAMNCINTDKKNIQETIAHVKKEGEKRMDLNMNAYVEELKAERDELKAELKAVNEQLKAKETELLQKQFNESAEIKKLNEEFKPFKDMKVSAKTLNETLKKAQDSLKKEKAEKAKISEELESYRSKCGSINEVEEATRLAAKSLKLVEQYRRLGTVSEIKEALSYLNSVKSKLRDYNQLQEVARLAEKCLPEMAEVKRLKENVVKLLPKLKEAKKLEVNARKALKVLEQYKKTYGKLPARSVIKEDAIDMSKKYRCTVESAAKLINKYGKQRAAKLMEKSTVRNNKSSKVGLREGKKLVEEVAQLDKVTNIQAEKSAKDFLKDGMVRNYFNQQALGKEVEYPSINTIDGTLPQKQNAAKELLKKYTDKFEVEKAPEGLNKELTPAQAEAEAKKLLK